MSRTSVEQDRMFGDTVTTGSITWNPAQDLLCIDEDDVATQFDIDNSTEFTDDNIEGDVGEKASEHRSDKRMSQSSVMRQSQRKKQKKLSMADKLAMQMERICSAIECRSYAKEFDPYKELIEALKAIPEVKQNQELYFFALDYFSEKKDNRQIFMSLDDDQEKVTWLKYKFAQRNHH